MQELVLLISSLAGAASAVAVHKIPRGARISTIGASRRVRSEVESLENERNLLDKAVARLYDEPSLRGRDELLEKYQGRISEIRTRIEALEAAGSHPDLGPVGEGLITLMDQKLSSFDARLREMSAKMQAPRPEKERTEKREVRPRPEKERTPEPPAPDKSKALDMVTLTVHPAGATALAAPEISKPQVVASKPVEAVPIPKPDIAEPQVDEPNLQEQTTPSPDHPVGQPRTDYSSDVQEQTPSSPEPTVQDETEQTALDEYDDENLEDLKKDILKALDKIEQAEVE